MLDESRWAAVLPAIVDAAARHDEVAVWHEGFSRARRQPLIDLLDVAVASGAIADVDTTLLADQLVGPLFLRRLMIHEAIDDASVEALVQQVLGSVMLTS
jgi:translation initiation factor 6 (eIF-6)